MNNAADNKAASSNEDLLGLLRKHAISAIIVSFILATTISIICLCRGRTDIFQNTFYIPLLIAALYFPRKSVFLAFFASLVYLLLVLVIGPGIVLLFPALIRVFFFLCVTGVTVHVSLRREKAEAALQNQLENLEVLVKNQTQYISKKLERSNELGNAYRKGSEYYEHLFMQMDTPVVMWNEDLYITGANKMFGSFFNQERSEIIGRNISSILPFKGNEIRYFPFQMELPARGAEYRRSFWIVSRVEFYETDETFITYVAVGMEFPSLENI